MAAATRSDRSSAWPPSCPLSAHPFTRVRGYGGTQSYLDRIYLTPLAMQLFPPNDCSTLPFDSKQGVTDHIPLWMQCGNWTQFEPPQPRPFYWNSRDLHNFRSRLLDLFPPFACPENLSDATELYTQLCEQVVRIQLEVHPPDPPRPPKGPPSWPELARSIIRGVYDVGRPSSNG